MAISFDLTEKTILVTGASSGIGQSIATNAAAAGAKILLVARNEERLQETADMCDGRGIVCPQDLTDLDALPKFIRNVAKEHGPLSGLVHSAGIEKPVPLRALRMPAMQSTMEVNTYAAIMLAKGFSMRGCCAEKSSIVLISSVMGHVGNPALVTYSMSKGAIELMIKSLALELLSSGIRVNGIAPAMIATPMLSAFLDKLSQEEIDNIMRDHPGGIGQPEDVAAAAIYLLSDASKYVTGTSLLVDGGYCAR